MRASSPVGPLVGTSSPRQEVHNYMTPRERVLAAIALQEPDRTPRDFWAEKPTLRRLLEYTGDPDEEALLKRLGIDVRHLQLADPAERPLGDGVFQNHWGERYTYQPTPWGPLRTDVKGALAGVQSLAEIEAFPWPSVEQYDYRPLHDVCRRNEPYALIYGFADVWERPALVRGWEDFLVDMVERPDWAHALCRIFTDFYLEDYTRAAEASAGRIDLFLLLSDLGTQKGPLISPAMFRSFVAPYIQEMIDRIHALGARVMYHSCGDVRAFLPDLVAMGVDVLDPIQPVNDGMSPERLKADFGDRICFHGGLDTQGVLPCGTPEQVAREALRYCETLGRGGGYILAPAHLFQPDVPPENVLAAYQTDHV